MSIEFIKAILSISRENEKVLAHVVFLNNTNNKQLLNKYRIYYDSRIQTNQFEILDEQKREVDYLGQYVKRLVSKDDNITVDPGGKIEVKLNLSEGYEMEHGKKYTIQYSAFHPTTEEEPGITKVESNIVEVVC